MHDLKKPISNDYFRFTSTKMVAERKEPGPEDPGAGGPDQQPMEGFCVSCGENVRRQISIVTSLLASFYSLPLPSVVHGNCSIHIERECPCLLSNCCMTRQMSANPNLFP